jgi:tetratricopeptide (TPR) repeat protein
VAGLHPGEVIATLDGVEVENREAFLAAVQGKGAGTVVQLGLVRPGKERQLRVALDPQPEVYRLDEQVSQLAKARKYGEAMVTAQRALALGEQLFGPDDPYVAALRVQLGSLYGPLGRAAEAERLYTRALAVLESALSPDDLYVADSLGGLADIYGWRSDFDDAIPLYQRALDIREKALGANHPDVRDLFTTLVDSRRDAIVFNSMRISTLLSDGRYAEAEPLYKRVLALVEKADGSNARIELAIDNLMKSLVAHARYAEAEPLMRRGLAIAEKEYKAHPENGGWSMLVVLNHLGRLLQDTGRFAEAEVILRRALTVAEQTGSSRSILGQTDPASGVCGSRSGKGAPTVHDGQGNRGCRCKRHAHGFSAGGRIFGEAPRWRISGATLQEQEEVRSPGERPTQEAPKRIGGCKI